MQCNAVQHPVDSVRVSVTAQGNRLFPSHRAREDSEQGNAVKCILEPAVMTTALSIPRDACDEVAVSTPWGATYHQPCLQVRRTTPPMNDFAEE